jgi:acyl-coenzyme A thioesterase PaaI-like protein
VLALRAPLGDTGRVGRGLRERLAATGAELGRLVGATRRLIDATVSAEAPADVLATAADAVERVVETLRAWVPEERPLRFPEMAPSPEELMPFDPVMGAMSPLAPPIRFTWEDPKAIGRVRFGTPYEGPPGCVHGGIIAGAFDQVFNVANLMRGVAGPTARLALRYRRPTPLHTDLRFEGWQERVEGRRVHTSGRLLAGDDVTVEAEGVFVQVPIERIMRMFAKPQA